MNATNVLVSASDPDPTLADIGELLAWIGAAVRESPLSYEMAYSTPQIFYEITSGPIFVLDAVIELLDYDGIEWPLNGTCWHHLVRNPVIVKGFPIPRRGNEERGLEIPLELMASLGKSSRATIFGQGLVMKGYSTMLVPIKRIKKSVVWHFLCNEDETRIPYLDANKFCHNRLSTEELDSSDLEVARNFVGWSSSVHL